MILDHYKAVEALMPPGLPVHLASAPKDSAFPHVVLWGDLGAERSGDVAGDSLADIPDSLPLNVRATYVSLSAESVFITAQRVRNSLRRARPVVAGRSCSKLRQSSLTDIQVDTDVTINSTHPVFAVDEFSFVSDPA